MRNIFGFTGQEHAGRESVRRTCEIEDPKRKSIALDVLDMGGGGDDDESGGGMYDSVYAPLEARLLFACSLFTMQTVRM